MTLGAAASGRIAGRAAALDGKALLGAEQQAGAWQRDSSVP
jgi:hypothetical protein